MASRQFRGKEFWWFITFQNDVGQKAWEVSVIRGHLACAEYLCVHESGLALATDLTRREAELEAAMADNHDLRVNFKYVDIFSDSPSHEFILLEIRFILCYLCACVCLYNSPLSVHFWWAWSSGDRSLDTTGASHLTHKGPGCGTQPLAVTHYPFPAEWTERWI